MGEYSEQKKIQIIWSNVECKRCFFSCQFVQQMWLHSCLDQALQKSKQIKHLNGRNSLSLQALYDILLVLHYVKYMTVNSYTVSFTSLAEMVEAIHSSALFYLCILMTYSLKYWH